MVNASSKIPLYVQVKQFVLDKIQTDEWPVGHMLPTEQELQDMMNVSRVTVRHAMEELEQEGLVVKKQGKGTFVSPPKLSYPLPKLTSFSEDMRQKGFTPASHTLEVDIRTNPAVAKTLALPSMTQFLYLRRRRMMDNMTLGIHDSHITLDALDAERIRNEIHSGTFVEHIDARSQSLYGLMENEHNVKISYADESLEAMFAGEEMARLLEIEEGRPVLFLERITYDDQQRPVEYVKMYNRADIYKYSIRLTR